MPRAVALVALLAAAALPLTGCLPTPPELPTGPGTSTAPQPPAAPGPGAPVPQGDYRFTIDDQAGDTWSFSVTGIEIDPALGSGDAGPGMRAFAVLIDARHDEGSAGFLTCFDVELVVAGGRSYAYERGALQAADTDIRDVHGDDVFEDARVVIAVHDGAMPEQVLVRARYGSHEEARVEVSP